MIPIVVISYNQLYFLRRFIEQLKRLPNPIIILDNNSSYLPLFEYYNELTLSMSNKITIHRLPRNYGHTVHENLDILPSTYILSDPDLELSKDMPTNVSDILLSISDEYKTYKTGLALDISDSDKFIEGDYGLLVKKIESSYYEKQIENSKYTIFDAPTDTTFCLINWNYKEENKQLRVGGEFTAKHLPWYNNYLKDNVPKDELACWINNNTSSSILENIDISSLLKDDLDTYATIYPNDKHKQYGAHDYITNYNHLLNPYRYTAKNVLEIGIGELNHERGMQSSTQNKYRMGNSLRMWRDYFTHAQIYGIDISPYAMFDNESRITTLIANQSSHSDLYNVVKTIKHPIDVIIDDGAHIADYQVTSFKFLEKFLKEGGIYIIEDIQPPHIDAFLDLSIFGTEYRQYILDNYEFSYYDTRRVMNRHDDILIVFKKKIKFYL